MDKRKVYIIGVTGAMATAVAKEMQGKQIDAIIVDDLNDLDKQECQETIKIKNIYVPTITERLYDQKPIYKNTPGCMPKKEVGNKRTDTITGDINKPFIIFD